MGSNSIITTSIKLTFSICLSLALEPRGDVLGHPFIVFLAPGLIIQSMMLQSFSHSTSSLMISKMQGNIIDLLYAPNCFRSFYFYNISSSNQKYYNWHSINTSFLFNCRYKNYKFILYFLFSIFWFIFHWKFRICYRTVGYKI